MSGEFNQPLDFLPVGLLDLNLGYKYTQSLNNLPNTLRTISLWDYPLPIDNLPDSLISINIRYKNYPYKVTKLPKNLKYFKNVDKILNIDKIRETQSINYE